MRQMQCKKVTPHKKKKIVSPLWSCQKQKEWCHVLLWQDTRQPATPTQGLWFCCSIGGVRYGHIYNTWVGRITHKCTHLGFLLLRLSVISFTQHGWLITRLKPDWKHVLKDELFLKTSMTSNCLRHSGGRAVEALPGSSWWLAGTLCTHVHHLSGWNRTSYASCSPEWS